MHLAILVTNTDRSAFAERHPRDLEMFEDLLRPLRPDWQFTGFDLTENVFPDDLDRFDGVIVTGSPASVNDNAPWIERMMALIREIEARRLPMFGACFGHQAIAKALGGSVDANPSGWQIGHTVTGFSPAKPWLEGAGEIGLYAAHKEQVTVLPSRAHILSKSAQCPVGAFAIGDHVFTTQYHPEMTPVFIDALIEEMADELGQPVTDRARETLRSQAETARFAGWLVGFFEHAASHAPQLRAGQGT